MQHPSSATVFRAILLAAAIVTASVLSSSTIAARSHGSRSEESSGETGRFDYYLMSLSWSPSFCTTHPDEREQCGGKGLGFVLHGLWPQNRNGSWPQHCESNATPDQATIARALAFMPSRHLIEHEWQTHGSCTGLDPKAYFELADRAFASVKIPAALVAPQTPPEFSANDLERAFVAANPGMSTNMVSVECHVGELSEVRVCLNKDTLTPQVCAGRERNTCRSGNLAIPAIK